MTLPPNAILPQPLTGIVPPLLTPLTPQGELDTAGLEQLLERVIEGGVSGVFVLGTTGEAPSLSYEVRRQTITAACQQAAFRVPVLVGVTDSAPSETIALAKHAAEAGAQAIVAAPPFYFPMNQQEMIAYFTDLAEQSPLPLYLYNMPGMTKVFIEDGTVAELMKHENIIGVKDSSGDMNHFHRLMRLAAADPKFTVLIGPEELTAEAMLFGGHGGVNGGANLHPRLYVAMAEAAAAGDLPRARRLHSQVMQLAAMYRSSASSSTIIASLKYALSQLGVCGESTSSLFPSLQPHQRKAIDALIASIDFNSPPAASPKSGVTHQ